MMKHFFGLLKLTLAILLGGATLTACTTAQQSQLTALATTAVQKAGQACKFIQPTLVTLQAAAPGDSNIATLVTDNGKVCDAVANLDPTNANTLINTIIPQAVLLVDLTPLNSDTKSTIKILLVAASAALSNWLVVASPQSVTNPNAVPVVPGKTSMSNPMRSLNATSYALMQPVKIDQIDREARSYMLGLNVMRGVPESFNDTGSLSSGVVFR